jgi:hypothetical protein
MFPRHGGLSLPRSESAELNSITDQAMLPAWKRDSADQSNSEINHCPRRLRGVPTKPRGAPITCRLRVVDGLSGVKNSLAGTCGEAASLRARNGRLVQPGPGRRPNSAPSWIRVLLHENGSGRGGPDLQASPPDKAMLSARRRCGC